MDIGLVWARTPYCTLIRYTIKKLRGKAHRSLRRADVFPVVAVLSLPQGREAMTGNTSALRRPGHIVDASQMFLYNDFPLILRLLGQIASILSSKYFCRRGASLKAFFPLFKARPQFQPVQDSGLPVHVYGLTDSRTYSQCHDIVPGYAP